MKGAAAMTHGLPLVGALGGMAISVSPLIGGWVPATGNPWTAPVLVPVLAGAVLSLAALIAWAGNLPTGSTAVRG